MTINCQHHDGSRCTLGKFGGKPSPGVCERLCEDRVARDASKPALIPLLVKGTAGLAKAALGIDRADEATIAARRKTCAACPNAITTAGIVRRCKLCRCALAAKVVIAGERCPVGKW